MPAWAMAVTSPQLWPGMSLIIAVSMVTPKRRASCVAKVKFLTCSSGRDSPVRVFR